MVVGGGVEPPVFTAWVRVLQTRVIATRRTPRLECSFVTDQMEPVENSEISTRGLWSPLKGLIFRFALRVLH